MKPEGAASRGWLIPFGRWPDRDSPLIVLLRRLLLRHWAIAKAMVTIEASIASFTSEH